MKNATTPAIPTFDQNQNDALMKAIGAKGYDPMPPSQHAFYEDRDQPLANRLVAVVYQHTIRRGAKGKRSPAALGERGRPLTVAEIAERLKVTTSNAWVAARQAEADGRIRFDEEGRIWLGGQVREPRKPEGEGKAKDSDEGICAKLVPEPILLYLKELPPERADRALKRQIEIAERFNRARADADALLRQQAKQAAIEAAAEEGYKEDAETRGRPRVAQVRTFSVRIEFAQNQNGHFAHNSESTSAQKKTDSAQIPQPYVAESYKARELQRVSADTPTESAPSAEASTPPPTPLTETRSVEAGEANEPPLGSLNDPDPIVDAVQTRFGRKLDPDLRSRYMQLPAKFEIPKGAVVCWIAEKWDEKQSGRYKINSPGALLAFALDDLPGWMNQQHGAQVIKRERNWEQAEEYRLEQQLRELAAKKTMRAGGQS